MSSTPYAYLTQSLISTCLIQPTALDSFFFPVGVHTGFAADGQAYLDGVLTGGSPASWYSEPSGAYRGASPMFPSYGLVLLSDVSLTILDESTPALNLWMQFLMADGYAIGANNNSALSGYTPASLTYGGGKISLIYTPDAGSELQTNLVLTLDFSLDQCYISSAMPIVNPPSSVTLSTYVALD